MSNGKWKPLQQYAMRSVKYEQGQLVPKPCKVMCCPNVEEAFAYVG